VKLPAGDQAVIDARKLRDYILSPSHPVGRFKAAFFETLGFSLATWQDLESALRNAASRDKAEIAQLTPYGQKYRVRSILRGPNGRSAVVVSIWITRTGDTAPRFVTVMPER
jgi:hypothetical protein